MKKILLCTYDPMLVKSLYGPLRDEGYRIDEADNPAGAVRMILREAYEAVVLDSDGIGLGADEAAGIIRNIAGEIKVVTIGGGRGPGDFSLERPVEIDRLIGILHGMLFQIKGT